MSDTLLGMGQKKDAAYYLKTALSFQADNADALAVKAKLQPWTHNNFEIKKAPEVMFHGFFYFVVPIGP